jgi:hypothetical protein
MVKNLNLNVIMNLDSSKYCCICDETIISKNLEKLVLEMLDPDILSTGEYVGIFIEKNGLPINTSPMNRIVSMAICNIEDISKNQTLIIELLCSNPKLRIRHTTLILMNHIVNMSYMYGFTKIKLKIASGKDNKRAYSFYMKLGFVYDNNKYYTLDINNFDHDKLSFSLSSNKDRSKRFKSPISKVLPLSVYNK